MHSYPIRDAYEPQTGASCAAVQMPGPKPPEQWPEHMASASLLGCLHNLSPETQLHCSRCIFFFPPLMIMTTCPRFCGYEKNHISCMSKHNHNALGRQLAREEQRGEISLNLPTIEYFMVS